MNQSAVAVVASPETIALPVEDAADAPRRERGRVGRPPIEESIELLMPSQFRTPAHESWWPGEKRLMLAVLTDAVEILATGPAANGPRRRALYEETVAWFASDDTQWPFSFINVCDTLCVDPAAVRRALRRRRAARASMCSHRPHAPEANKHAS